MESPLKAQGRTDSIAAEISAALALPGVTDLCIQTEGEAYLDRGQGFEPYRFSAEAWAELFSWALLQTSRNRKSLDARLPFVDGVLEDQSRFHFTFPPIAPDGTVWASIRKFPSDLSTPFWIHDPRFQCIKELSTAGANLIISGGTGSGKTTLAREILAEVPRSERIIAIEDTPELSLKDRHFVSFTSRYRNADGFGEISPRELLRQTLRMKPDRIVLGECRGPEILDLLQALNTGHGGFLSTLHANSTRQALSRIELLARLHPGAGSFSGSFVKELIAQGIHYLVHVERTGRGRQIVEVQRMMGLEGDQYLLSRVPLESMRAEAPLRSPA